MLALQFPHDYLEAMPDVSPIPGFNLLCSPPLPGQSWLLHTQPNLSA
jgi:hypothetical protein